MKRFLCTLALLATTAFGADLTGKWKGELEVSGPGGESRKVPAYLELKQEGNTVTGTGGPNENEQKPLTNVKLDGTTLRFEVQAGEDTDAKLVFNLEVSDTELKGSVKKTDDPERSAKLLAKRVQ